MKKHEAKAQPGLFFWAEPVTIGNRTSYTVVAQAKGYPPSEAHGDWFATEKDADEIAQQYAQQYPNH